MHQSWSGKLPVNKAGNRANCIEAKPKHQVLWTVPAIYRDELIDSNAQIVHQPVSHPRDAFKELFVRPCLAFENEEEGVGLIA